MSLLSDSGRIFMVREPVSARFGIHRLMAMLSSGALHVKWNGIDEISVLTFNKRKNICKIIHADKWGVDCTTRMLNTGIFQVILNEGSLPIHLNRAELEELLRRGTAPERSALAAA